MAYDAYRSRTGYNSQGGTMAKAAAQLAAEQAGLAKSNGAFTELPVTRGVGPYHVNHFIGYGALLPLSKPAEFMAPIAAWFHRYFVTLFEPNDAGVEKSPYRFKGGVALEFSLGGRDNKWNALEQLGGLVHHDWVTLRKSDDGESFYASTLRRDWLSKEELLMLGGVAVTIPGAVDEALEIIRVNHHHFLAGRRSFRFGYDSALQRPYVETAAFERSSLCEYYLFEKTGVLRDSIISIWTKLIRNVRNTFHGVKWVSPDTLPDKSVRAGYQTIDDVDYRTGKFESASDALEEPWFAKVLTRHPGLLP